LLAMCNIEAGQYVPKSIKQNTSRAHKPQSKTTNQVYLIQVKGYNTISQQSGPHTTEQ